MIKIYRKTATITAEQFDPDNGVVPDGVFDKDFEYTTSDMLHQMANSILNGEPIYNWHVETLEGDLKVKAGDWIATGVDGEHWAINNDIFKKTYAGLPMIPKTVANQIDELQVEGAGTLSEMFYLAVEAGVPRGYAVWILDHESDVARA